MRAGNLDPSKKTIVCFDLMPTSSMLSLKRGDLAVAVDQLPGEQVAEAMKILVDYVRNQALPPQKVILLKPKLVTKDSLPGS